MEMERKRQSRGGLEIWPTKRVPAKGDLVGQGDKSVRQPYQIGARADGPTLHTRLTSGAAYFEKAFPECVAMMLPHRQTHDQSRGRHVTEAPPLNGPLRWHQAVVLRLLVFV